MLNITRLLFDEWERNGVNYCHWKSNEHLNKGLDGITDLDVLVDKKNKDICSKVLTENKYVKCIPQLGTNYRNVEDWIGCDNSTGKLIHIHLHYEMITGHKGLKEYTLPWRDLALSTKIKDQDNNIYIINPTLELLVLYTRIALKATPEMIYKAKNKCYKVPNDVQRELDFLKARYNKLEFDKLVEEYYPQCFDKLVSIFSCDTLSSEDFLILEALVTKRFNKHREFPALVCSLGKFINPYALGIRRVLKRKFEILFITRKTLSSNGKFVVFIGADGAGKSTLSTDIEGWLNWKVESHKFYLGSGDHYSSLYSKLLKYLYASNNRILKKIAKILNIYHFVILAKRSYRLLRKANRYKKKGGIAIFDRYPQIQFKGLSDGPKIIEYYYEKTNNKFVKSLIALIGKREESILRKAVEFYPDIVFKLVLPPEVSLQRKPDHNFEDISKKAKITKELEFPHSKIYTIDATKNYEEEILEVQQILWESMERKSI